MHDPHINWVIIRGDEVIASNDTTVHNLSFLDYTQFETEVDRLNTVKLAKETLHQLIDTGLYVWAHEITDWLSTTDLVEDGDHTGEPPILNKVPEGSDTVPAAKTQPNDWRRKFNDDQVREIRAYKGKATAEAVSERFGVSSSAIYSIWSKKTYQDVE